MTGLSQNKIHKPGCLPGFEQINRYWDNQNQCYAAKILPGEFYVTRQNEHIVTVLGSCVSACIRDVKNRVGGMNHFMLPVSNTASSVAENGFGAATRYGNFAMEYLINEIMKNGGRRENLEIKIFGGGRIIGEMTDIGRKNIEFILAYIKTENMNLLAQDVGDIYPRKIHYIPATGKVKVKRLRSMHNTTIVEREKKYMQSINSVPAGGDIELF